MATRTQSAFLTVKTEGALLPADLLKRLSEGDKEIEGLSPENYHLDPSDKINEATNQAWIACRDAWERFQKQRSDLPEADKGTSLTRERWLLKLFQELGYGRLQTQKSVEIEGKTYGISHGWGNAPIHLISFRYDLDTTSHGAFRTSPHSLVQEFLNRSDDHLWAFVSNGLQLRILRDNVSFSRPAYVEFDLEAMMEGEVYSDFLILWLLCHQSRVESELPEQCWLEKWHQTAKQQGTRVLDRLRDGVEKSIEAFGQGFLAHRGNVALRQKLADGKLTTPAYYQQLLRLVYRLIFLFVAEDRDLLLTPDADSVTRKRYEKHYALSRIRRLAERRRGTRHSDLWEGVKVVFKLLYAGEPRLGLPALGSMLFSAKTMPDLDDCALSNDRMLEAIRYLAFTVERNVLRQVDYKNLGSEELGSVYESLLELHPDVNADAAEFELSTVAGSERKTTGSYYTPSSLINCLLDSALDPVVEEALKKPDREKAILDLKVCDPACGSGHFLIAAANRLSHHLATVRTGDEEPSPAARRAAFRDVVSHCIYGVDINPMAVELCKVALWLESIDPGKPLSFLDHRILCGNSLIGATPRLLAEGIPDDAFKAIEGDTTAVCNEYRRRNKDEKKGQLQLDFGAMPSMKLGNLVQNFANLAAMEDESLEDVEAKEKRYAEFVESTSYQSARLLADAWCAAFVWKKDKATDDCITESWFRRIEANPHCLPPWMREAVSSLRHQHQFFHWHLSFPDVFHLPGKGQPAEKEHTGWSRGFDVVLGNPPWERVRLEEKQWFAARCPEVATARTAAERKRLIRALKEGQPSLHRAFVEAKRHAEGQSHFARSSGLFPLSAVGDVNTYQLFGDLATLLPRTNGHCGMILPTGLVTDNSMRHFFAALLERRLLISLLGFINSRKIFQDVKDYIKFGLFTFGPAADAEFAFMLTEITHVADPDRRFTLSPEDFELLNPNTKTCPIFANRNDARITKRIYRKSVALQIDGSPNNPWSVAFLGMFHMSGDSGLFQHDLEPGALPLYEAKMIYQFDHRFATYENATTQNINEGNLPQLSPTAHLDPNKTILPRYWVRQSELDARLDGKLENQWMLAFRDITGNRAERTAIFAIAPRRPAGNSMPILLVNDGSATEVACLLANLNSYVFDFAARQKVAGAHMNFFVVKQLPVLPPVQYDTTLWNSEQSLRPWLLARVLELTVTNWELKAFGEDAGYLGPPFTWDEERRFLIRRELDALFFHLYAVDRADIPYILENFYIIKNNELRAFGHHRTKDTMLDIYDEMARAIASRDSYHTRLDPPPGPPADEQGNFLRLPDWQPGQPRPADWPSHIHPPREVHEHSHGNVE